MRTLTVATVLLAALALAGCTQNNVAAPTPTATASATPTPTPTLTPTTAPMLTSITVGGQSIVATDQFGTPLNELTYNAPDSAAIETFTALFGFEPVLREVRRGVATDAFSGTVYTWEGFSIAWRGKWADEPGSGYPRVYVSVGAAAVRGITIATADGFAVGQPGDLVGQFPDSSESGTTGDGVTYAHAWTSCIPIDIPNAADCVSLVASPSDGPITLISAPYELNHGL